MKELYDLGYQNIKSHQTLVEVACILDAVVLDIRASPRSRDPRWNKRSLMTHLVERYVHVADLGNINYRDWSAPIVIANIERGLDHIRHYLETNSVILLCACHSRDTCHRKVITDAFQKETGIASIPLDLAACSRIIAAIPPDPQLKMF